jgi:hypothetical protein
MSWQDSGVLGFTPESFAVALRLSPEQAEVLFERFDTDKNGKVDALEVLAAQVTICKGSWDEKFNALVRIFDFSGSDNLSLDELHIFIHSTLRGILKLTQNVALTSELTCVPMLCERIYESAASSKSSSINQTQLVRWLTGDEYSYQVFGQWFLARPLDECLSTVSAMHASYTEAFKTALVTATSLTMLRKAKPLTNAVGRELGELLEAAHRTTKAPSKTRGDPRAFDRAAKAFAVCKYWTREYKNGLAHGIPIVDIRPALWLFNGREPTNDEIEGLQSAIHASQKPHQPAGQESEFGVKTRAPASPRRPSGSGMQDADELAEARRRMPWRAFVDMCIDLSMKNDPDHPTQIQVGEVGKNILRKVSSLRSPPRESKLSPR